MTPSAELHVRMGGELVAVLDGRDRRRLRLRYDDAWLARHDATPLSVSLPLAAVTYAGRGLAAYLWGLLPDNDRVIARWATRHQCSPTDVFGLLYAVGADVAGAAQYLPPDAVADEGRPGAAVALTEDDVAGLLRTVRSDRTAWHPNDQGRWSLAGAQAKLALAHDPTTGRWSIPTGAAPTTHILKPAIAGLDHHDLNEHLCLSAAGRLGLRVAHTEVRRLAGEPALVVARYDRLHRGGRIVRVHQEDCCQGLGVHPERKYQADGGPGLEDLARLLHDVVGARAVEDVDVLLRAAAYSWLVLGTDAHAKNYSLLLSGRQVRLAPLYDIASAAPYATHPRKLKLAQKVGGEYRPTVIGRRHWERTARAARVDGERLRRDIVSMATDLPDALADAVAATELVEAERDAAHHLLDAVAAWTRSCVTAMGGG